MKSVIQMLSGVNGFRSEAMTVEKRAFADFLAKQKLSDDEQDRQYVMFLIDDLESETGVVSREPFITVRQFIFAYSTPKEKDDG